MSTLDQNKKLLILSILRFLDKEEKDIHTNADNKESIMVAIQCLEAAYGIDYNQEIGCNAETVDLLRLLTSQGTLQNAIVEAEEYKTTGNQCMTNGLYDLAIRQYSRAIGLNSTNAVYYCNRAAAYSRVKQHENAIGDCKEAVRLDPNYAKAYSRMGIAYLSLNKFQEAKEAYLKAIAIEPENTLYHENLRLVQERITPADTEGGEEVSRENALLNDPSLMNFATQLLYDPNIHNIMSGLLNAGNEAGMQPNMSALVQMGQQLAEEMQRNNPDFVDNLRRQFGAGVNNTAPQSNSETGPSHPDGNTDKNPSAK